MNDLPKNEVRALFNWIIKLIFVREGVVVSQNELLESDATKLIFDHVRNFTLASVIAQVGSYAWYVNAKEWANYITKGMGVLFVISAIILFALNFLHGEHLLEKVDFKVKLVKKITLRLYWSIYFISALTASFYRILIV